MVGDGLAREGKCQRVAAAEMAIRVKNGAAALAVAVFVAAAAAGTGSAQQIPACASKLVPCAPYLNSTSPPESCCGPLKQAAKDDMECLCALFKDKSLLETFKIDVEQGLKLAKSCGVSADQAACSKVGTRTAAAPSSSGNSTVSPPAKSDKSAAHEVTWFGMSGIVSLLLLWWSVMG